MEVLDFYKENKGIPWDIVVQITKDRSSISESMESEKWDKNRVKFSRYISLQSILSYTLKTAVRNELPAFPMTAF